MGGKLKLRGLGHLVPGLPDSLCQTPADLTSLPVLILLTAFVSCKGCRHSPKSLNLFLTFITSCSELHSFSPSASFSVSLSLIFGVRVGSLNIIEWAVEGVLGMRFLLTGKILKLFGAPKTAHL